MVSFLKKYHLEVFLFGVLVFILVSLIVDLFVHVNWISVHWSWTCLRVCCRFYVGCMQIRHMGLLFPQPWGRSWKSFRLGVQNCLYQLIDQKFPSSSFYEPSSFIFELCVLWILDKKLFILILILGCVIKLSVGRIQIRKTALLPPQAWKIRG